jgi:hypothetical protein
VLFQRASEKKEFKSEARRVIRESDCPATKIPLPPSVQVDVTGSDRVNTDLQRTATSFVLWSKQTKLVFIIAEALALDDVVMSLSGGVAGIGSGQFLSLYVIMPVLLRGRAYVLLRRGALSVDSESMTQRPQAAAE